MPWLMLLSACSGGSGRNGADPLDFTLRLRPLTPLNQPDLFDDIDGFTITVDRGPGDVEVYDLGGTAGDGTVTSPEIAALDGDAVGIYGYDAADALIAYGRSSSWTLPSDEDDDVPVLIGRVGAVGRLTDLPGDLALVGGAMVTDGQGRFRTLGGDERGLDGADDATNSLLQLDIGRPNDSLSFIRTGVLPDHDTVNGDTVAGLAGHTATRLTGNHQFQDWVLVAGGAQGMVGSSTVTDRMLLWSPDTEEVVTLGGDGVLPQGSYHHTADEFGAGYIAILGGGVGRRNSEPISDNVFSFSGTGAVFEPRSKVTEEVLTGPENGNLFLHDAATVNGTKVIACGGLAVNNVDGETRWQAQTGCDMLDDSFVLERLDDPAHDLPLPLLHHDMTSLPDGRVLLSGGFTTTGWVNDGGTVSASDDVWVYSDGVGWEYVGALNIARGMHEVSVLADGTVLIVGGATTLNNVVWGVDDETGCLEIIDPSTIGNASLVGDCEGPGFDADELATPVTIPLVATDPAYGTVIVGGADDRSDSVGQVAWFVGGILEP